jgi:hypothetical protein
MDQLKIKKMSKVNPYYNIIIIGDPSKTLLFPLWSEKSEIPGAWTTTIKSNICTLWDIHVGSISYMYPSNSIDFTILFYDTCLRKTSKTANKYTIKDYIKNITLMKGTHQNSLCIILKSEDSSQEEIGSVIRTCKLSGIKDIYVICNNGQDISSLKTMVSDIVEKCYQSRKQILRQQLFKYIYS